MTASADVADLHEALALCSLARLGAVTDVQELSYDVSASLAASLLAVLACFTSGMLEGLAVSVAAFLVCSNILIALLSTSLTIGPLVVIISLMCNWPRKSTLGPPCRRSGGSRSDAPALAPRLASA